MTDPAGRKPRSRHRTPELNLNDDLSTTGNEFSVANGAHNHNGRPSAMEPPLTTSAQKEFTPFPGQDPEPQPKGNLSNEMLNDLEPTMKVDP